MGRQAKRSRTAHHKQRRNDRDTPDAALEPRRVFAEVETFEELAPTLHALLLSQPSGTRIYVRFKENGALITGRSRVGIQSSGGIGAHPVLLEHRIFM
jgi:hypothetical protein